MGRTVNPLSFDFRGSNPLLPTDVLCADTMLQDSRQVGRPTFGTRDESLTCGSSSVGRATAFQAVGRGFEPRLPLQSAGASATRNSESRCSSGVEHFLGKEEVVSSILINGSIDGPVDAFRRKALGQVGEQVRNRYAGFLFFHLSGPGLMQEAAGQGR